MKPLLHLWSLGVEEQYYLVWPLLLFALRGRRTLWLIAAIAAGSFAINLWSLERNPLGAMFLPQARFWELMSGGALAYASRRGGAMQQPNVRARNAAAVAGFALIAASMALFDEGQAFPGWRALLPTVGTALVIFAGPAAWFNKTLLSNRPIVYVGLISYALYLWHWPILAYLRILNGRSEVTAGVLLPGLLVSFVLAVLTYELVEKRIRFRRASVSLRPVMTLAVAVVAIGAAGALAFAGRVQARSAADPWIRELSDAMRDWRFTGDRTIPGAGKTVLFGGDSLMRHLVPRIDEVTKARATHNTVVINTRGGCLPIPGIERPRGARCNEFAADLYAAAAGPGVDTVIIAGSWSGRDDGRPMYYKVGDERRTLVEFSATENTWVWTNLETALRRLTTLGKRVIVVLELPRGVFFDPGSMAKHDGLSFDVDARAAVPRAEALALVAAVNERVKIAAQNAGAEWVDPAKWLCTDTECPTLDEGGRPIYKDAMHLRASFVRERLTALDEYITR